MMTSQSNAQMATPTQDRKQMTTSTLAQSTTETVGNEIFDAECLKLINEYFYGVRLVLFFIYVFLLVNVSSEVEVLCFDYCVVKQKKTCKS